MTATGSVKAYKGMGMEGWIAKWYASTTLKRVPEFQRVAVRVAAELPSQSRILEVAPGPGYLAIELAKAGNFEITGLDISETFVGIARENAARERVRIDFRRGNAAAMPFENDTFDRVICTAAFKNFFQPVKALEEMRRVLRPSGKAIVMDLRKDTPLSAIDTYINCSGVNLFSRIFMKWTFRGMLLKRAYTIEQFGVMARQAGFTRIRIEEIELGFEATLEK